MSWGAHGTIGPADKQYFPGVNTACARSCGVILSLTVPAPGALHVKKYSMHAAQLVSTRRWVAAFGYRSSAGGSHPATGIGGCSARAVGRTSERHVPTTNQCAARKRGMSLSEPSS